MKKITFLGWLILFLVPMAWGQEKIEAPPEWRFGDQWIYSWKNQKDKSGTGINTIIEVGKLVEGISCYVMKKPNRLVYYNNELQPVAEADLKGKITLFTSTPVLWIFWPLEVGKSIDQLVKWKKTSTGEKIEYRFKCKVEKAENVSTPAGDFLAWKIVSHVERNMYERWYSHQVKNYVKMVDHLSNDTVEHLLVQHLLSDKR